ncbi:hypothetical protein QBC46DRAFT_346356 [Diplogelasinospora grovesii]|uniref:DUF8035 domain-containing protein n=1 Tax=Diplogelasinospora grovesii TaxID=303347 RepID=A0AAN6MY68_9PEZI|nr:hypothetical protein QBC46DRAFT_346356 [Diplogelasinospora grovesii]
MTSRSRVEFDEREYYQRERRRSPGPRGPPVREYEDVDIRIRERSRERVPAFLREDRRPEAGPMVLRQREVETVERPRRRSPSPFRVRETFSVARARSVSPHKRVEEDVRIRTVERMREPSRAREPSRVRTRIIERSPSPSPPPMERIRIVERGRSPSPVRERIRIVERENQRAPSPSPSPPPPAIKAPPIEREIITHYRGIDHGIVSARSPSPPPVRRSKGLDAEIDIYKSRRTTEVDIDLHKHPSRSRGRSVSRERPSPPARAWDDEVIVHADRNRLHVDISGERRSSSRPRRAHSAAPPALDYDDEAEYITSKIDSRGKMGEAWGGITKDWTIVDVPPGTERVRMDGAGGASAEVTWQKYSGVRRAKFIPDRNENETVVSSSTTISDRDVRDRDRERERDTRLSVQIYDKEGGGDREREIDIERRRAGPAPPPNPRRSDMWTEITKDLVSREAIEELGYEYEETEYFYYIMQYLRYEDVLQLVQLSDAIRKARKDRVREIAWEREWCDHERERSNRHRHRHSHSHSIDRYDDERIVEREVVYDRAPARGYR